MKSKWAIVAAGILVATLIPIPYLASSEWSVMVVDEGGKPIQGLLVRLDYQDFSTERVSHEEDRNTDESGRATFAMHRSSASALRRCYYTALSATALAHASFGPSAYVNVFGDHFEGSATNGRFVYFWTGHPDRVESRIIAHPMKD